MGYDGLIELDKSKVYVGHKLLWYIELSLKGNKLSTTAESPAGHIVNVAVLKTKTSRWDRKGGSYRLNYTRGVDVLLVDTAGRLHNKKNLMNELSKINSTISKEFPEAYRETLIVLDGTTGQNALVQAKEFSEVTDISGIVLTKLDGTAKGGIAIAIQSELKLPVKYIGVGETIDDLEKFNPEEFVNALFYSE